MTGFPKGEPFLFNIFKLSGEPAVHCVAVVAVVDVERGSSIPG